MSCPNNALLEFSRILFDDLKLIQGFLLVFQGGEGFGIINYRSVVLVPTNPTNIIIYPWDCCNKSQVLATNTL